MFSTVLLGLVIGYVLAIPPGPITFAAIRMGFRAGWPSAVRLAIGAGALDIVYCLVAMVATSAVSDHVGALMAAFPAAATSMQLAITGAMIGFGVLQLRTPKSTTDPASDSTGEGDEEETVRRSLLSRLRSHGPVFIGIGFALANMANPTFLPALAAMSALVQQTGWYQPSISNAILFSIAFGIGQASWLLTVVRMLLRHRDRMTPTFIHRLQQAAGVVLILFGTGYALRILTLAHGTSAGG